MIKDIQGYEGLYKVSSDGYIISCEKPIGKNGGRIQAEFIKAANTRNGYRRVELSKNDKSKYYSLHRIVADHFIPKVDGKDFINHIDGDKANNKVDNLEWVTRSENEQHSLMIGLRKPGRRVIQHDLSGVIIKEWVSTAVIRKETGFNIGNIQKCCDGVINKSSGYKWSWL